MNVPSDNEKILQRIEDLIKALTDNYYQRFPRNFNEEHIRSINYEIVTGKKYYKINVVDQPGTRYEGRSVHAFVNRQTGAVYKPASFKAPAKIARYNLLDDISYQECLRRADCHGHYLYLR